MKGIRKIYILLLPPYTLGDVMETKTVKISALTYRWIYEYAGEIQREIGEPVSIDKALTFLFQRSKLSDLAGSWKFSDKEAEEMQFSLKKGWSKWKIKSV